ncbi:MAG: glucosamine inositolphosphorylceramide transferase family protein [Gaiellaceae bacterium]
MIAVLVDEPLLPWQRSVLDALERAELPMSISPVLSHARQRSFAVQAYAKLDRWPASVDRVDGGARPPGGPEVLLDLTSAGAETEPAVTAMFLSPRALDDEAMLAQLAAGHQVFRIEVRVRTDGRERLAAASTVALTRYSARRSAERVRERAAALVVRALGRVAARDEWPVVEPATAPTSPQPASLSVLRLVAGAAGAAAALKLTRVDWRVAYGNASPDRPFAIPDELRHVPSPPGRFYADPFLAKTTEGTFLFVEDFDLHLGRAGISVVDLATGEARSVLAAEHHLSYPFVFEVDGTWYMLPEQATTGRVELLRCEQFPDRWVTDTVLLDGVRAYDATLFHDGDLWWLFCAMGTGSACIDDELHVWHAPTFRGPFTPHRANPVVSNVVGARPAGRIVRHDGRLFRPAQDGSGEYGRAIVVNEILALTPTDYREEPVAIMTADDLGADGIHTLDVSGNLAVIDTKHRVRRWSPISGLRRRAFAR